MEVFDFYENLENYYNSYKPEQEINLEKFKEKKKYVQLFFVLTMGLSIYYFYNK